MSSSTARSLSLYYKHSGAVPPAGLLEMVLVGLMLGLIGGGAYGLASEYSQRWVFEFDPAGPSVCLHVFIAPLVMVAFVCLLGFCLGKTARAGKVRNSTMVALLGLASGLFGLYASWVAYLFMLFPFHLIILNPRFLLPILVAMSEAGTWSLGFGAPPLSGPLLVILWLAEAAAVTLGTAAVACRVYSGRAFCERCGRWLTWRILSPLAAVPDRQALVRDLEAGDYGCLNDLYQKSSAGTSYTNCELESCPDCGEIFLLTVKSIAMAGTVNELLPGGGSLSRSGGSKCRRTSEALVRKIFVRPEAHEILLNAKSPEQADSTDAP